MWVKVAIAEEMQEKSTLNVVEKNKVLGETKPLARNMGCGR